MDHVRDGGWGMYPTMLFGFVLLVVAVKYAADPAKRWVPLLVGLSVVTLTSGGLGFMTGLLATAGALGRERLGTAAEIHLGIEGFAESLNNIGLAYIFLVLGSLVASVGALRVAKSGALLES